MRFLLIAALLLQSTTAPKTTVAPNTTIIAGSGTASLPTSVPGLQFWYDGASANCSGACTNGATLSSWTDLSGNGNTGTTTAGGCTYTASALNSQPGVACSGTTRFTLNSDVTWGGGITIFAVVAQTNNANKMDLLSGPTGSFKYWQQTTQGADKTATVQIGAGSATPTNGTYYQINITYDGTTLTMRRGEAADVTATNAQTISTFNNSVGGDPTGIEYVTGTIAEIFVYNTVISGTNKTAMESYLNGKYGI